jgi:UDP-3-O-[3-hydroxymyristoyl] glucosamine N-acyltransferase
MQQHLILGYSENVLSLLLEVFQLTHKPVIVTILQNIEPVQTGKVPFIPPGVEVRIIHPRDPFVLPEDFKTILGIYTPGVKQAVYAHFLDKLHITESHYENIIHPSSVISSTAVMSNGLHVEPLSVISPFAELSFGVSVNRNVSIGHHTSIGRFSAIGPGTAIGGNTRIGNQVQIGIGSVIFNEISIGSHTVIGGGSVVTSDIPGNVVAWGNPCKVIRPATTGKT